MQFHFLIASARQASQSQLSSLVGQQWQSKAKQSNAMQSRAEPNHAEHLHPALSVHLMQIK